MKNRKGLGTVLGVILLAAVFWIVRYWHSLHFGLYEDDLTIIPTAFNLSFGQLMRFLFSYVVEFQGQGRPLHHSFIYLFSWLGWHTAGLWGPYLFGYLLGALNASLFYLLLRRVFDPAAALLGGLAYVLFSADTTQAYLTLSLGVQPSVTFVFLACHAYLSNKRILAYILAFLVLLGYETPFLIFLAAPLLQKGWNRRLLARLGAHALILAGMLALIYLARLNWSGVGGVLDLGPGQMIGVSLTHLLIGPAVSLGTYGYRPLQAIQGLDLEVALAALLALAAFLALLYRLPVAGGLEAGALWKALRQPAVRRALPEEARMLGRMLVTGAVMLLMAYPLTFTVRAYAISGRDTRVHLAGAAGAAILVAAATLALIHLTARAPRAWRLLSRGLVALELALMVGYGFVIQRDYVQAWQYQRQFWTELVPLIPDAGQGTVILVDPAALHDTRQIGANYWNLPRVLYQLFTFPEEYESVPLVHRLEWGWQDALVGQDGRIRVDAATVYSVAGYYGEYEARDVILIRAEGGRLVRVDSLVIEGQTYTLKAPSEPILPGLPHGFLYDLMIVRP